MNVKLLQFLIGKIDAELFQAVDIQNFEAIDIEQTNPRVRLFFFGNNRIDIIDDPIEQTSIKQLAQRIPLVLAVLFAATSNDRACTLHSRRAENKN